MLQTGPDYHLPVSLVLSQFPFECAGDFRRNQPHSGGPHVAAWTPGLFKGLRMTPRLWRRNGETYSDGAAGWKYVPC